MHQMYVETMVWSPCFSFLWVAIWSISVLCVWKSIFNLCVLSGVHFHTRHFSCHACLLATKRKLSIFAILVVTYFHQGGSMNLSIIPVRHIPHPFWLPVFFCAPCLHYSGLFLIFVKCFSLFPWLGREYQVSDACHPLGKMYRHIRILHCLEFKKI